MSKQTSISTKIKIYGAILISMMIGIIIITIYLNQKNINDALLINISGKQRMLTQRISKDIFYIYSSKDLDFKDLDKSITEFENNLIFIKHFNSLQPILKNRSSNISKQLAKVEKTWTMIKNQCSSFKQTIRQNNNSAYIKALIKQIYKTNMILLRQSNILVTMFTKYSESKISHIKNLQLAGAFTLMIVMIYFIIQLKSIESHALKLMNRYKNIPINQDTIHTDIDEEDEIVEISDTINCLLDKVGSAMRYSAQAVEQSQMASAKLEEITDEFDHVLGQITKTPELSKYINSSEDMVIQSTEELTRSTQKLKLLKKELDTLLIHCKTNV